MSEIKLPESTVRALMEYRRARNRYLGNKPPMLDMKEVEDARETYRKSMGLLAVEIDIEYMHFGEEGE